MFKGVNLENQKDKRFKLIFLKNFEVKWNILKV